MKYIITGTGNKSDIGTTEKYTELGWELMVSRLAYIRDLHKGLWTTDDTVVTISDRKFLYSKIAKNVIGIEDLPEPIDSDNVFEYTYTENGSGVCRFEDLGELHDDYTNGKINQYKYIEHKSDILNVDYSNVTEKYGISGKFAGALVRIRKWCSERNLNDQYYSAILDDLKSKYGKVFVFGMGSERVWKGKDVVYIDNLQDWASVMNHPLCDVIVAPGSGGSMLCQICCNSKLLLIQNCPILCERHPLFFSSGVTFSDLKIKLISPNKIRQELKTL
jgi:hypothetical protein